MSDVSGIVLAGGQGRRMGGVDKGLVLLRGKPMVAWVLGRLAPQVNEIIVNANQNVETYAGFGHRVVSDAVGGFAGPLAGILAGVAPIPWSQGIVTEMLALQALLTAAALALAPPSLSSPSLSYLSSSFYYYIN